LGLGAAPAFGGAGADQIALDIGEAAENGNHQAPGAGAGPTISCIGAARFATPVSNYVKCNVILCTISANIKYNFVHLFQENRLPEQRFLRR